MKMNSLSAKSLSGAVLLGLTVLVASPSFAANANPCAAENSVNIKKMDANHDGKLSKQEYLAAMGAIFDKHAGAKGYCTPEEAEAVRMDMLRAWQPQDGA
jgi:hypothetical protein